MKKKVNVLLTGVGSTTAISVIKGLKKQNEYEIFIVGIDIFDENDIAGSKFCNKFFMVPPATNEIEYISKLLDIINRESIDVLIPIIDIELEVIAKNINVFKNIFILLSNYETIIICNDKLKTYEFFKKFKIPTLETVFLENLDDFTNMIPHKKICYPFIIKPRKGVSSRDVYEIRNFEENGLIKRIEEPIIQEKGYGNEYTIDIFGDGKRLISAVPRIRIETRSGISYKGKTVENETLIKYCESIYRELKFMGPANLQCFVNDGDIKFFDINPRFSGSLPLTIESGVNTPLLAIKMVKNHQLEPITNFKIVKMCRYWDEVFF
jgi:carbamoyl-phosphate synthase large subunit